MFRKKPPELTPKYTRLVDLESGDYAAVSQSVEEFARAIINQPGETPWQVVVQPGDQMKDLIVEVQDPSKDFNYIEMVITRDPNLKDEECLETPMPGSLGARTAVQAAAECMTVLMTTRSIAPCHFELRYHATAFISSLVGELDESYRFEIEWDGGKYFILTGASADHDLSFELLIRTAADRRKEVRMVRALNTGAFGFTPGSIKGWPDAKVRN